MYSRRSVRNRISRRFQDVLLVLLIVCLRVLLVYTYALGFWNGKRWMHSSAFQFVDKMWDSPIKEMGSSMQWRVSQGSENVSHESDGDNS